MKSQVASLGAGRYRGWVTDIRRTAHRDEHPWYVELSDWEIPSDESLEATSLIHSDVLGPVVLVVDDLTPGDVSQLAHLVVAGSSVYRRYQQALADSCEAAFVFHGGSPANVPVFREAVINLPMSLSKPLWSHKPVAVTAQEGEHSGDPSIDAHGLPTLSRRIVSLPRRLIAFYSVSMTAVMVALIWLGTQFFIGSPVLTFSEALFGLFGLIAIWIELFLGLFSDARDHW